jgi:hypothetical protein
LEPVEARALLDSIDVITPIGLRDRALIGLMVYSFARIGAALSMKVDLFSASAGGSGCASRERRRVTKCPT